LDRNPVLSWAPKNATGTWIPNVKAYAVAMHRYKKGEEPQPQWLIYDIPSSLSSLPTGITDSATLTGALEGVKQGLNYQNTFGYKSPCPEEGGARPARYSVHVYALSEQLPLAAGEKWKRIKEEIAKVVLAEGHLEMDYAR
jgi:phosphatidylethanolamine-binding protein (PEBP) family uncharacterized protein